jgi:AmmeMemoRadiSam system protein A
MFSADPLGCLSSADQQQLLSVARQSIATGLETRRRSEIDIARFPDAVRQVRACFVTLRVDTRLRGCLGTIEPRSPLVVDVARNAFGAAFCDIRFPALTRGELPWTTTTVSVLSQSERLSTPSEADAIEQLRPGLDGVTLRCASRVATFLPTVWEMVADPRQFLRHLRLKAGLPPDYWSDDLQVARYTVQSFSDGQADEEHR